MSFCFLVEKGAINEVCMHCWEMESDPNAYRCVHGEGVYFMCTYAQLYVTPITMLHFVLLNLMQRFLKNHQGKGDFSAQKVGIFFQS